MGVSGSGKTTIGKLLAERFSLRFFDGDDFHSKNNVQKTVSAGNFIDAANELHWNFIDAAWEHRDQGEEAS